MLGEVVITGGGAHLSGISTAPPPNSSVYRFASDIPSMLAGLTDTVKKPEYATAVGLVLFGPAAKARRRGNRARNWRARPMRSWFGSIWS